MSPPPKALSATPSLEAGTGLPRPALGFNSLRRVAPWGLLAFPILGALTLFLAILVDDGICSEGFDESCDILNIYVFVGLEFAFAILLVACVAILLGGAAASNDPAGSHARYAPLLQGARDWYVRGDVTEEEYQTLRADIEAALSPNNAEATARRAAGAFLWGGVLYTLGALILVPVTFVLVEDASFSNYQDPIEWPLAITFAIGTLAILVASVAGWVLSGRTLRAAKRMAAETESRLRAQEEIIIRAAHQRSRSGAPEGTAAQAPSYRSFRAR